MTKFATNCARYVPALIVMLIAAVVLPARSAPALKPRLDDWRMLLSAEYGFMLAYPGSVFAPDPERSGNGGHVLVSRDGRAKLLVATFENEDHISLKAYRQQLIEDNYPDAALEFTPMGKRWFVLSGTQGETHFYYRVTFTCAGGLINSWAIMHPVAERSFYDRVVEAVHRSYTPGAGSSGRCG
jgi:hypothetical protein